MVYMQGVPYVVYTAVDGSESLSFAPVKGEGWAVFQSAATRATGVGMFLRFGYQGVGQSRDEPIQIRELQVVAETERELGGSTLARAIPWRRLEAAVNRPDHAEAMRDLVPPGSLVSTHYPLQGHPGLGVEWWLEPAAQRQPRPRLKLKVPTMYRKPDEFYAQVADRFLWLASMSERPAQELAEANDMNPATVHRWIREARARGLLQLPTYRGDA